MFQCCFCLFSFSRNTHYLDEITSFSLIKFDFPNFALQIKIKKSGCSQNVICNSIDNTIRKNKKFNLHNVKYSLACRTRQVNHIPFDIYHTRITQSGLHWCMLLRLNIWTMTGENAMVTLKAKNFISWQREVCKKYWFLLQWSRT